MNRAAQQGGGMLIVRVRPAPDSSWAIVLTRVVGREELPVVVLGDVDDACARVRDWLDDVTGGGPLPGPRPVP